MREVTGGVGADVAFECSGHPDSVRGCLDSLRPMGRYTQVGICGREIQFPMDQVFYKQLTVRGSITYTAAHVVPDDEHFRAGQSSPRRSGVHDLADHRVAASVRHGRRPRRLEGVALPCRLITHHSSRIPPLPHSVRSATSGSTLVARCAGISAAAVATRANRDRDANESSWIERPQIEEHLADIARQRRRDCQAEANADRGQREALR